MKHPEILALPSLADLVSPATLGRIAGERVTVEVVPLAPAGRSPARHARVIVSTGAGEQQHFMLKESKLSADWTARRTGDILGREALLPASPAFAGIWTVLGNPYLAVAHDEDAAGVLMRDLTPWLHPPAQALTQAEQDLFLRSLARLHARYWRDPALSVTWLAGPAARFGILGPAAGEEELQRDPDDPLFQAVARGWSIARDLLPAPAADLLFLPTAELVARFAHLPHTLLHGDAKVANAAFTPQGVSLFDWATVGHGPATLDLGYVLAIDRPIYGGTKEEIVAVYRHHLSDALGYPLADTLWRDLWRVAVVGGARMLLWSRALGMAGGSEADRHEWEWWVSALGDAAER